MRICECCQQPETPETRTCLVETVTFLDGLRLPPLKYDPLPGLFGKVVAGTMTVSDARVEYALRSRVGCPVCAVAIGQIHHVDCEGEPCPRCGELLMSECRCERDCEIIEIDDETEK